MASQRLGAAEFPASPTPRNYQRRPKGSSAAAGKAARRPPPSDITPGKGQADDDQAASSAKIPLVLLTTVLLPLLGWLLYLPYNHHNELLHPDSLPHSQVYKGLKDDLNLNSCQRIEIPGNQEEQLGWCGDVTVHRHSGIAYFVCDDTRPWHDPVRGVWDQVPEGKRGGSLWAWNLKDETSSPKKLQLPHPKYFHPISISVVNGTGTGNQPNIILVSNHAEAYEAGVIEVYRHDLKTDTEDSSDAFADSVYLYDEIKGEALNHQNPHTVVAIDDYWSDPVRPGEELFLDQSESDAATEPMRIPSFLFTALPSPHPDVEVEADEEAVLREVEAEKTAARRQERHERVKEGLTWPAIKKQPVLQTLSHFPILPFVLVRSVFSSITEARRSLKLPEDRPLSFLAYLMSFVFAPTSTPPKDVYLHISKAYTSQPIISTASTTAFQPLHILSWDALGESGGSNTTMAQVYVSSTSPRTSLLEQWDQHWVRGLSYASETMTNRKTWKTVTVSWPQFVTFWSHRMSAPLGGMDIDSLGRIWLVSPLSSGLSEQLISALREGDPTPRISGIQPGAVVRQLTYTHQIHGGETAHPWEVEKLASWRRRGIWTPKEWFSNAIYQLGLDSHTGKARKVTAEITDPPSKRYLPKSPTAIAVDEESKTVIVASSWDDGVARCHWIQGWVEM